MSTEAAEDCILLERAFLRIGSANTDQQFESLIDKLLGPIIFKVSSSDGRVRQKAIELLTHISKRIKCRPEVQLPVQSLLQLYFHKIDDNFVKNFLTVYIKLGFSRLSDEKQLECITTFLKCIESPGTDQLKHTFLNLTLKCCKHFTNAKHTSDFVSKNNLNNWSHANVLLDYFYHALLLPHLYTTLEECKVAELRIPPGMSPHSFKCLMQDGQFENFVQIKLGVLHLLAACDIPIESKYVHYVAAFVDSNSEVAELGKLHIKISNGTFELSENILRPLYVLFVGDGDQTIPEKRKKPADLRIKTILLPFLQRLNVYCWPECIQVVVACLMETNNNAKIKISGLQFGLAALQKSGVDSFKEVSPDFLSLLCEMIWSEKEEAVRTLIYQLAGNVISLNPELVKYHEKLFPKFIEDLTEEKSPTVRNTIKESLLKMANAFKRTETPIELMHFLANRITSPEPSVKQIVLHYLQRAFAPDHIESRFLLCWASADNDPNVAKEAEIILLDDLKTYESSETEMVKLPKFERILNFVYDGLQAGQATQQTTFSIGDQNLPLTKRTYVKLLSFVRKCMLYDCYRPLGATTFEYPCSYSPIIGSYLHTMHTNDSTTAKRYLELIWLTLTIAQEIEPLQCFIECVGTVPDIFARLYVDKLTFFQKILCNFAENLSFNAAIAMGVILTYGCEDSNKIKNTVDVVINRLTSKNIDHDEHRGSLYYLGCVAERGGFERVGGVPQTVVDIAVGSLDHSAPTIVAAACYCTGQIVRKNRLQLPNRNANELSKYERHDGKHDVPHVSKLDDNSLTKLKIVDKLLDLVFEKNNAYKVKMKAAEALGFFCIGDGELPFRKLIIKAIVEREGEEKMAGTSSLLGDVIADCVMGQYSVRLIDLWTQKEADFKPVSRGEGDFFEERELFLFAFQKIADELIWNEKCKSKTAAAIWLLLLVKRCYEIPLGLEELSKMQYTFLELMARNDEIIHEAATRGLSFIPKLANEENTAILAKQLTDKICLMHKGGSEIGAVLGMYEEFGYLVSSLKNCSLIYHFLSLLNHRNRNKDEKYALTLNDGDEELSVEALKPYLTQIAPSLYVYRYHQSSKIKQAMNTIWNKLFSKDVKAVQSYSKTILEAAIKELTCPNPELRIAYCLALENLLQIEGNSFISENKKLMSQLVSNLYRLMDDRKESVRKVAYGTTKMFLQAFVKNIHRDRHSDSDNELLNDLFPILLNNGVASTVNDIRSISVKTLSDIIEHLGSLIKSHLYYFIPCMIENVNEIETNIRYVDEGIREIVEDLKEGFLAGHFSTEIIKKCMKYVDEEVLEKMLPKLSELLKDNTSYTVKLAAINFVVLLTSHLEGQKLQPFVGKLLGALFGGLSNNHKNVRKSAASAIGVLCKSAKESSIDNLLNKLVQLYLKNTQDENVKSAVGQTILAIGAHCQDAVQARSEKIVPIIFFAMHLKKAADGSNDSFIELWKEVWNDVIGSMEVALVKHKIPIIVVLKEAFNSPSWNTKTQAARAFATFVGKCSDDLRTCEEAQSLIQDMVNTLGGKFWRGKDELMDPVAMACSKKTMVNDEVRQQILETVLRECGRGSIMYRTSALEALGKIYVYSDYDRRYFDSIYDMLRNLIAEDGGADKSYEDMETEEVSVVSNQQIKLKETAFAVLGTVWPADERIQALYQVEIVKMLTDNLFASTRLSQVSIIVSLKNILSKSEIMKKTNYSREEETLLDTLMENVETSLRYALELKKHTLLKKEALHTIINLMETFTESSNTKCFERLLNVYSDHANQLSKNTDPIILLQTSTLKELLKRNLY